MKRAFLDRRRFLAVGLAAAAVRPCSAASFAPQAQGRRLPGVEPVVDGHWVRPAEVENADPVWGLANGLRVGLWPTPGPRGLIRVYAPYLGQARHRVINFIAIEPLIAGKRGYSELELGTHDQKHGKPILALNALDWPAEVRPGGTPARGQVGGPSDDPVLSIFFHVEPFQNGAEVAVEARFRPGRPNEVELLVHASPRSRELEACILTATMGNYARLRRVWLNDRVVTAAEAWREFRPDENGFTQHVTWPLQSLRLVDGEAWVAATTDEADPTAAAYDADVNPGWHYAGRTATQYWHAPAVPELVARANARATYWASKARIPNGAAIENFELEAPFRQGQSFTFGIDRATPVELGWPAFA